MPRKGAHGKTKRRKLTLRQVKMIAARAQGKTYAQAAAEAGYSLADARGSGYQAMQQLRGRVPELLDRFGLSEEALIDKYLRPLLDATETVFFQKDGKVKQRVDVAALAIRHAALRTAFELHGSYAPRDPKEAAQFGVKVIVADLPGPPGEFNQFINVIPEKATSKKPTNGQPPPAKSNGHGDD